MDNKETLYIIGESRTNSDNAITKIYGSFYMALEIEADSGRILEFGCTHSLDLTELFLRRIFVGKSLLEQYTQIEDEVARRYHGSSAKAVLAAMKDAEKRYRAAVGKSE
ncbi:DUF3870 domain-containing protein [Oscillibacter ruminantium]|jgi:beta-lactamase class A|uniref:DUF3870 domain-containing protein n=1 Tax=Oscillibacter ruminantium TaxID=1263547 RepID=UPI000307BEAD|nr:DUF3870 domain-containing protein [Oscillibacter ruminantium]MDN0031685.1 DUF3870 domain-containing protein [Oscillibacter valericigenes]MEA5042037.1 DUF3870 domain-containing protein [Oscillibacter ruminantium]